MNSSTAQQQLSMQKKCTYFLNCYVTVLTSCLVVYFFSQPWFINFSTDFLSHFGHGELSLGF